MKTFFTTISLIILAFILPQTSYAFTGNDKKDSITTIRRMDISNDSTLCRVLENATDTVSFGKQRAYYTLSMHEYKDGMMIRIRRSNSDIFEAREYPFGYTMVNNQLIVIANSGGYAIKDYRPKETMTIKIARKEDQSDITHTLFYFILDNEYAKFSPEEGWVWSDGKPDE